MYQLLDPPGLFVRKDPPGDLLVLTVFHICYSRHRPGHIVSTYIWRTTTMFDTYYNNLERTKERREDIASLQSLLLSIEELKEEIQEIKK